MPTAISVAWIVMRTMVVHAVDVFVQELHCSKTLVAEASPCSGYERAPETRQGLAQDFAVMNVSPKFQRGYQRGLRPRLGPGPQVQCCFRGGRQHLAHLLEDFQGFLSFQITPFNIINP